MAVVEDVRVEQSHFLRRPSPLLPVQAFLRQGTLVLLGREPSLVDFL